MKKILVRSLLGVAILVAALAVWIAVDLNYAYKTDIRSFDADEVARLDTAMWRSYYARERFRMYRELTELMATQYKLPFWRRQLVAFYAAKGAFIFKDGRSRDHYLKALPDVEKFYAEIRDISTTPFDAKRAAELEVEWWIIHRERKSHQEGDLARALAETGAVIYEMPVERFLEHGDLRARAMAIRDTKAETGGVSEQDWQEIDALLNAAWRSLHTAVNTN